MAGGTARIAAAAGRARRAAIVHQHGYHHHLDEGLATMLADISLLLLAALGIAGLTRRLGVLQQRREGAAFRTGREFAVTPAVFLHHYLMTVAAAVGRELQGLQPILRLVFFRQVEVLVFAHHGAAVRTMELFAVSHLLLEDKIIDPP